MDSSEGPRPVNRGRVDVHKERMLAAVELAEVREINARLPFADPIWLNVTIAGVEVPIRPDTYRQADARRTARSRRRRILDRMTRVAQRLGLY